MISKKMIGVLCVSAALLSPAALLAGPAAAEIPVTEAQPVDDTGSASGSATYSADGAQFLVCLLTGRYTGSKAPLC